MIVSMKSGLEGRNNFINYEQFTKAAGASQ